MKCSIRVAANTDILRQFEYYSIDQDAEAAANRFIDEVERAIQHITRNPGIGSPKQLANGKFADLRSCPVRGFSQIRIYYLVADSRVWILRVLHGKRDIETILEAE